MMAPVFRIAPKLFGSAAIYGFIVLLPMYFADTFPGLRRGEPINHPELLYGFVGAALCFQAVFVQIARHPLSYKPLMLISVLYKLSFGVPVVILWLTGRADGLLLTFGIIDLIWAAAFLYCWRLTPG